jgi:NADH-quinone oxidoreductase subunit N
MGDFELILVMPVICLAAYGLLALLLVPWLRGHSRYLGVVSLIGLVMTGAFLFRLWDMWRLSGGQDTAFGLVRIDGFGLFFSFILLLIGVLSVLYSMAFLEREEADQGEFYPLVLFCLAGMLMMLHTTHLMMVLIGLEVFSLALYVLTGLTRMRIRSVESSLKYFLLGAFSSGFFAYGLALLYGATGTLSMEGIRRTLESGAEAPRTLWVGLGLVLIGLGFKIAIVPFHQWVPDVYQGAPTNITGFMAAATKTAAFAVLLRFLVGTFGADSDIWIPLVTWLAILTMTVANLIALAQRNLKRLLAFSSIAHAGYLLIAVVSRPVAQPDEGVRAILFYLTAYALMTVGAFAVLAAAGRGDAESERGYNLSEWAGLGWRRPMLALAMSFFLFSLAGLPPTGGFFGKYVVFMSAIHAEKYVLAVIGMLNATVAVYYYLRVVVTMYMREPETDELPLPVSPATGTVMLLSVLGVLYLGLAPGRLLDLLRTLGEALV